MVSLETETFVAEPGSDEPPLGVEPDPMLEKFHFPDGVRNNVASGSLTVMPEISRWREKIRGISFTPTAIDLVLAKSPELNAGSSEIETLSTVTPADRMERRMLPTSTLRFSAAL